MKGFYFGVSLLFVVSTALAGEPISCFLPCRSVSLRPIVILGGGVSFFWGNGQSQTFPILNPIENELYQYHAPHNRQTAGVFSLLLGAEKYIRSDWLLQLGMDYDQTSSFSAKGTFTQGADPQSTRQFTYQNQVLSRQVMVEVNALYTFQEIWHPYILIAAGLAYNQATQYQTNVPPFLTFTREYQAHTGSSFTYKAGIGIDVDVVSPLRLGLGYRFSDLGKVKFSKATIDGVIVSGTLSQPHIYTNELVAEATVLF